MPSIWISNTNKSHLFDLFELHHAVRRRWVAQSEGSWNYRVKILMERSQSLCRWSQRIMLMFSKLHLGNTSIFIYLEHKLTEHGVHALFQRRLLTPGVFAVSLAADDHSFLASAEQPRASRCRSTAPPVMSFRFTPKLSKLVIDVLSRTLLLLHCYNKIRGVKITICFCF